MAKKLPWIIFIYVCVVMAWLLLAGTVQFRAHNQDKKLKTEVGRLWGTRQRQVAPRVFYQTEQIVKIKETQNYNQGKTVEKTEKKTINHYFPLDGSDVKVSLNLEQRKKGLLWYPTYKVGFKGHYSVKNTTGKERDVFFRFILPARGAVYDNFYLKINGEKVESVQVEEGAITRPIKLKPGETASIKVAYNSQGMEQWWYSFGNDVSQVKNFTLAMSTDFDRIDFPQNSVSPTDKKRTARGWNLQWNYGDLLSGVNIGMEMPQKLNPGPWVSKITFFAPVSLFFFFFLMIVFTALREIDIHPMNYFFIGASFFAYHLLLAYLVDHVSIHVAFWICSSVSIFLIISYVRLVVGPKFAYLECGLSQLVFLVLFSYTFFFKGYTGLAVTVMSVITLFIVMQMTARTDWEEIFKGKTEDASRLAETPAK